MYEVDNNGWWVVPNALNKLTVSARNKPKYERPVQHVAIARTRGETTWGACTNASRQQCSGAITRRDPPSRFPAQTHRAARGARGSFWSAGLARRRGSPRGGWVQLGTADSGVSVPLHRPGR